MVPGRPRMRWVESSSGLSSLRRARVAATWPSSRRASMRGFFAGALSGGEDEVGLGVEGGDREGENAANNHGDGV